MAGDGLADLTFAQSVLNASVLIPSDKHVSLNVLGRHESGRIRDWHYEAVGTNPVPASNAVYLDAGAQDCSAVLMGLLMRVTM